MKFICRDHNFKSAIVHFVSELGDITLTFDFLRRVEEFPVMFGIYAPNKKYLRFLDFKLIIIFRRQCPKVKIWRLFCLCKLATGSKIQNSVWDPR